MENCVKKIVVNKNDTSKIKERAANLAAYVNQIKISGIAVDPNEPIEGKMFWN